MLVQAAGVMVNLDIAVPCGLILNELITNAFKHAFPGDRPCRAGKKCEIKIKVVCKGEQCMLTVADNGTGLPADVELEKSETQGLSLVWMLAQQIGCSIKLDRSAGSAFQLSFKLPHRKN
jgi:two-component sensor histidine kinase